MQAPAITCTACDKRLFEQVHFCPYCGVATASGQAVAAKPPDTLVTIPQAEADPPAVKVVEAVESVPPPLPTAAAPTHKPSAPPLPRPVPREPSASPAAPAAPAAPGKVSRSKQPMVIAAVLLIGIAVYWLSRPNEKELACHAQLASAAEKLAADDATGARSQAVLALASCSADSRARAVELQAAADKALAVRANCEKGLRGVGSLVGDRRLQRARSAMDQLDTACADTPKAKILRLQIDAGQAAAASAEADIRQKLAAGDLKGARASLDQLIAANRDHTEIPALRTEIQSAARAQEAAATAAATPPTVVPAPAGSVAMEPPARSNAASAAQHELVGGFLRDAETALAELKFDKAKTYVESARRIDPANAQAASLANRIRNRELEYARKEMTIN